VDLHYLATVGIPLALLALLIFRIPELGLVLCVIIGAFLKGLVQPYVEPVDVTLCLIVATYVSVFLRSLMERTLTAPDMKVNLLVGLFLALLSFSLLYTPMRDAGLEELARFALLTISVMYMTVLWCNSVERIERLLLFFVGITLTYATATFVLIFLVDNELSSAFRAGIEGTSALGTAQLLAAGILAALVTRDLVAGRTRRLLVDVLTVLAVVELIALDSRGPLIALVAGGACLFLLASSTRRRRVFSGGVALLTVIAFSFALLPSHYTQRYALITDLASPSVAARMDMWHFVIQNSSDWFFTGAGISGFAFAYLGDAGLAAEATGLYPHNIFLDVFADAGFFALLVFACLIGLLLHRGIRLCRVAEGSLQSLGLGAVVPFVALLVASLFSGDITDTRPLWLFAGLILSLQLVVARIEQVRP